MSGGGGEGGGDGASSLTHRRAFRLFDSQRTSRNSFDRLNDETYYDHDSEEPTLVDEPRAEPTFEAETADIHINIEAEGEQRQQQQQRRRVDENKTEEEKDLDDLIDLNLDEDPNNSELEFGSHERRSSSEHRETDQQSLISHLRRSMSFALSKALPTQNSPLSAESFPSAASHVLSMIAPATRRGTTNQPRDRERES